MTRSGLGFLDRWLRRDAAAAAATAPTGARMRAARSRPSTKALGATAEDRALAHLQAAGLVLLARNYRTPGRGGGEVDLVLRDSDATLVFVEVRQRSDARYGGAGASIDRAKQRRIVLAARHWLLRYAGAPPPCRFDAVLIDAADRIEWLRAAFDAA